MNEGLRKAFVEYADAFRSRFQESRRTPAGSAVLKVAFSKFRELEILVDELEKGSEFRHLIAAVWSSFSDLKDHSSRRNGLEYQEKVKHFFRRSGFYIDISEGSSPNTDAVFKTFCEAFKKQEVHISYLLPMKLVRFSETHTDFGAFQIRRFTEDEIHEILQTRVNEIFYPGRAVEDVSLLRDHWFICLTASFRREWPFDGTPLSLAGKVENAYTHYPKPIEPIIQHLALFDWQADWWRNTSVQKDAQQEEELRRGWQGFSTPAAVLRAHDDLVKEPCGIPSDLDLEIDYNTEKPLVLINLDEDETAWFHAFVKRTGKLLRNLEGRTEENRWQFFEIALGYFVKGFLSEGLEQLLWHITVISSEP